MIKGIEPTLQKLLDSAPFNNALIRTEQKSGIFSMNYIWNFYHRKQISQWGQLYGHFVHSLTEADPSKYLLARQIQIEPTFMIKLQKWLNDINNSQYQVQMNQPDYQQSDAMKRFFSSDENVEWTYRPQNLQISISDIQRVKGVNIDRQKNYFQKDYSVVQKRNTTQYILSAKRLNVPIVEGTINKYKVKILTNRYPIIAHKLKVEVEPQFEQREHSLQIEESSQIKFINKFSNYWITDFDNFMKGNPYFK